jgi:hypothetical protein
MPPPVVILGVVEPVELVGVVIKAVGGLLGLVVVLAMVASGCFLFGALADDVELLAGELHDLFQGLFKVHVLPLAGGSVDYDDALIFPRRDRPNQSGGWPTPEPAG